MLSSNFSWYFDFWCRWIGDKTFPDCKLQERLSFNGFKQFLMQRANQNLWDPQIIDLAAFVLYYCFDNFWQLSSCITILGCTEGSRSKLDERSSAAILTFNNNITRTKLVLLKLSHLKYQPHYFGKCDPFSWDKIFGIDVGKHDLLASCNAHKR